MNPHQQLMIRNRNTIIQGLAAYNRRPFQIRHDTIADVLLRLAGFLVQLYNLNKQDRKKTVSKMHLTPGGSVACLGKILK
jgi:hypothetical protein